MLSNQQSSKNIDKAHEEILQDKAQKVTVNNNSNKQKKQIHEIQSETIKKIQRRRNRSPQRSPRKSSDKNTSTDSVKGKNLGSKSGKSHKNVYCDKEEFFLKENEE